MRLFVSLIFFFKQKTAYEMRISDWSSDVCSSDLQAMPRDFQFTACRGARFLSPPNNISSFIAATFGERDCNIVRFWQRALHPGAKIGRASCRERVCQYV